MVQRELVNRPEQNEGSRNIGENGYVGAGMKEKIAESDCQVHKRRIVTGPCPDLGSPRTTLNSVGEVIEGVCLMHRHISPIISGE